MKKTNNREIHITLSAVKHKEVTERGEVMGLKPAPYVRYIIFKELQS